MQQKVYWNKAAKEKKFTVPVSVELIKKYGGADCAILDFGCGYGRILEELKRNGFSNLAGVDIAENMIEIAKANLPGADLKVNAGVNIPYEDKRFDVVIVAAVLTCISDNEEQKKLIAEVKRVLRIGGIIYLCDFIINEDQRNISRYEKYKEKHGVYGIFEIEGGAVLRHHSLDWVDELVRPFEKVLLEEKIFTTMNNHTSNGFWFIGRKV